MTTPFPVPRDQPHVRQLHAKQRTSDRSLYTQQHGDCDDPGESGRASESCVLLARVRASSWVGCPFCVDSQQKLDTVL